LWSYKLYIYNIRLFGLLQNQHYCNYINSIEYILNHFTQYTCGKWRPKPKSQSSHAYCNLKHVSLSTKNNHSLFTCYFISFWVWSHSIWLVLCMLGNSGAPNYHELPHFFFWWCQGLSKEVPWGDMNESVKAKQTSNVQGLRSKCKCTCKIQNVQM
jgi:hypothetical protein